MAKKVKWQRKPGSENHPGVANLIPFKPGQSGNPRGKPVGQRNYATLYREALIELAKQKKVTPEQLENIIVKVGIARAMQGDHRFYADIMDRLYGKPTQPLSGPGGKDLIPDAEGRKEANDVLGAFLGEAEAKHGKRQSHSR